jgi:hydrogenase expression/formation protein HypC
MCLAVPARIVELNGDEAVIELDGVRRSCNVSFIHDPRVGDYVLLHAGFAIQRWTEQDFAEFQEIIGEVRGRE